MHELRYSNSNWHNIGNPLAQLVEHRATIQEVVSLTQPNYTES